MMSIRIRRIYDGAAAGDGLRVLIDRLWPRGTTRQAAAIDFWARDAAPSHELRRWYGHDPARWDEFQSRYRAELRQHGDALAQIVDALQASRKRNITLLSATKHLEQCHAQVVQDQLERLLAKHKK